MKKEQSFESMVLEFKQKINELQTPPGHNLSEAEFEILRRDKELRSKSASYRTLNEDSKADALESEILNIQDKVISIKEKSSKAPSGQQEIYKTIANTPDAKLHKQALKIQKAGLAEYERTLTKIEELVNERTELIGAIMKNIKQQGNAVRRQFDLFLKLRQIEKCLPETEHKAEKPPKAPEWSDFLLSEDAVGRVYGRRPFLIPGRY